MADEYIFDINVNFTIEVKHIFSKDEIDDTGGIKDALKLLGDELCCELAGEYLPEDISIYEIPERKNKNHKYKYTFSHNACLSFDEDDVSVCDEDLNDGALDVYEKEWKEHFKNIEYPVKKVEIFEGMIMEIIKKVLCPSDMAIRLIKKQKNLGNYYLSKDEFKRIAGRENLRDAFIDHVDSELREKGYVLIDLINEKDVIAVSSIETIMNWEEL
jgi:hypothetical protein